MQTEEVRMNEKCHRLRSSLSVALPYRSNSFVGKVPQKRNSLSMTLLVHRHFLYHTKSRKVWQCTCRRIRDAAAGMQKKTAQKTQTYNIAT